MEATLLDTILPMKIKDLVCMISKRKGLNSEVALYYLYSSELYTDLKNEQLHLWYSSSEALYSQLEEEKKQKEIKLQATEKEMLFCTFCIENYAKYKLDSDTQKTLMLFSQKGVFTYLSQSFELLHTQDVHYIVDTIDSFIKNRR